MQLPAEESARLRVGEFEVDLRCGEVRRNGDRIKLQQRPFQILAVLVQRPGEVLTREEIRQNLWPTDTFVDFEHSINTAVAKLREALGDQAEDPRFIETLPRYGYRLIAPVETVSTNGACPALETPAVPTQSAGPRTASPKRWPATAIVGAFIALLAVAVLASFFWLRWRRAGLPSSKAWVQITHFADSATQPALSPDGNMIAFIRGPETFVTPGEIYLKILPDGEPVQLTHDNLPKMAPAFSPDGSRIAYTATDRSFGWNTWVVPVLGGEAKQLLPNAAALTWTDRLHVVFSEIRPGYNMGIVTATESRAEERDIYLPSHWGVAWGMAHRSWLSPDRKWILVSEMDRVGWAPCRMVPFDSSSGGEIVGPKPARCTYAGWSPDGKTMYFSADAGDGYHIWRQRFPGGVPEQLTFGPTEEEGIAVSPDGRTLITSAGIRESTVWLHDSHGDRQISGEGYAIVPGMGFGGGGTGAFSVFSADGKRLFYLLHKKGSRAFNSGELWMADLDTGQNQVVLPDILMSEFQLAPGGEGVAFTVQDAGGSPHVWIASLDRRMPPRQLTSLFSMYPSFGIEGEVYFQVREGAREFLYRMGANDAVPQKVDIGPVQGYQGISPRAEFWIGDGGVSKIMAHSIMGESRVHICNFCGIVWGPGGKFLYLRFRDVGELGGGKTFAIELSPGKELPTLPPSGLKSAEDVKGLKVAAEIDMTGKGVFAPGPNPSVYAYTRITVERNLYKIPLE